MVAFSSSSAVKLLTWSGGVRDVTQLLAHRDAAQ